MTGFIFCNRFGNVPNPQSVNRAIKRIIADYNATEEVAAKKQHREAVLLPDFSAHHLRHTFCTRLCENETNLKKRSDGALKMTAKSLNDSKLTTNEGK